jgi:hypothetical protein
MNYWDKSTLTWRGGTVKLDEETSVISSLRRKKKKPVLTVIQ